MCVVAVKLPYFVATGCTGKIVKFDGCVLEVVHPERDKNESMERLVVMSACFMEAPVVARLDDLTTA